MWWWGKHIPFITYSCPEDEQPWTPELVSLPVPRVSAQPLSDGELTPFPTVKPFLLFPDRFSLLMHCELALNSQSIQAFFFFRLRHFADIWMAAVSFFFFSSSVPHVPNSYACIDFVSTKLHPSASLETLLILRNMILHFKWNLSSIFVRPTLLHGNQSAWLHYSIWGSTMR